MRSWRETGQLNPSSETKFSGAKEDRGIVVFPVQLTTSMIGGPYAVDPYSAINDDYTYIHPWCRLYALGSRFHSAVCMARAAYQFNSCIWASPKRSKTTYCAMRRL